MLILDMIMRHDVSDLTPFASYRCLVVLPVVLYAYKINKTGVCRLALLSKTEKIFCKLRSGDLLLLLAFAFLPTVVGFVTLESLPPLL